jgi:hypothetical protein
MILYDTSTNHLFIVAGAGSAMIHRKPKAGQISFYPVIAKGEPGCLMEPDNIDQENISVTHIFLNKESINQFIQLLEEARDTTPEEWFEQARGLIDYLPGAVESTNKKKV